MLEAERRFAEDASQHELLCGETLPASRRFTGVAIAKTSSPWTKPREKTRKDDLSDEFIRISVSYRTEFILFRSKNQYYLHKLGVSNHPQDDTFYSVIQFKTASEFGKILSDESDKRLRPSRPVIDLVTHTTQSEYLTPEEQEEWRHLLVSDEG